MSVSAEWRRARLDELCEINPPKPKLQEVDDATEVLFVPMAAVDDVSGKITSPKQSTVGAVGRKSYRSFTSGDVLFAKITPCMENGKSAIVPDIPSRLGFGSTEFHVLRPKPGIDARLIWHLIRQQHFRDEAANHFSGSVGQLRVPPDFLKSYETFIPVDWQDQRRLADILDFAIAKTSSAAKHLKTAQRSVDRFRQSVLASACSGQLTADWRDEHEADARALGYDLDGLSKSARHRLADPDLIWLPEEMPTTWAPATLGLLVERIEAGKSVRSEGRPARANEWGVLKVSAMSWGEFLENENKVIVETNLINSKYEVHPGDLLISRANTEDLVGATVLVKKTRSQLLLSDKSLRIVTQPGVDRSWLNFALGAPNIRAQFAERATGTSDSMRNLSQGKILDTTLALPPTEEQLEIARRVEELLKLADAISQRIQSASDRVARSSQAILSKAFKGELSSEGA